MPAAPRVSVIVPAYNVAPYIRQAVESALRQTLASLEVIVVDDGSTDGTVAQLSGLADPRLRLIEQRHAGVCASRNTGVGLACAPYIGFLDGDDLWLPEKLGRHLAVLETRPEIDLTFSLSRVIDEAGVELHYMPVHRGGVTGFRELLAESPIRNGSTVVLRREALLRAGPFDPALSPCEDCEMWLRVARLRPGNVYCVPEPLTLYRRRPGQLTSDRDLFWAGWLRVLEKTRRLAPEEVRGVVARASSHISHCFAVLAYEEGELGEAVRLLWLSVREAPHRRLVRPGTWLLAAACVSRGLLPARVHQSLEAWATRRRAGRIPPRGAGHGA